jgi:hypothetical protein
MICARVRKSSSRYVDTDRWGNCLRSEIAYHTGRGKLALPEIPSEMSNLPGSQDDVGDSQAGHGTAKEVVQKEQFQRGVLIEKQVLLPELHPREEDEK